ncbi:GlxA family transcriptional regulator [Marinomonas agarivorans]|nr:GlxA family transcriptional regulator [Marinomonas agarivorans]
MHTTGKPLKYGFVLLPQYSMLAFSSAIETLHMANWISNSELYRFCTISAEDFSYSQKASHLGAKHNPKQCAQDIDLSKKKVISGAGAIVMTDHVLADAPTDLDAIFICGASPAIPEENQALQTWLQRSAQRKLALGGICTGSYLLAKAGLLDGYRATIHWWNIDSLREAFPSTRVSNNLFEVDRDRFTCSGGTASMDMMLFLISKQHGVELASSISEQFVCERIRTDEERQRVPLKVRLGITQPKLVEAVQLMEANIQEPLSPDDIAYHVGISRRHLERLFKSHLNNVPSRYYLELRLQHARHLLLQTDKPVEEVGNECGFLSAPHFSTTYKKFFEVTPREQRKEAVVTAKKFQTSDRKKRQLWQKKSHY